MQKVSFWLMVVAVAIGGIYVFKLVAAQTNVEGLKSFAEAI
jgi:hypothetical protein